MLVSKIFSPIFMTTLKILPALAFSAGVAGVAAIVQTLKQDDHIIYVQCTNGDSDWLFRNKWKDFGIQVEFIYSSACESILQVMRPNTKVCRLKQEYKTTSIHHHHTFLHCTTLPQPRTACL